MDASPFLHTMFCYIVQRTFKPHAPINSHYMRLLSANVLDTKNKRVLTQAANVTMFFHCFFTPRSYYYFAVLDVKLTEYNLHDSSYQEESRWCILFSSCKAADYDFSWYHVCPSYISWCELLNKWVWSAEYANTQPSLSASILVKELPYYSYQFIHLHTVTARFLVWSKRVLVQTHSIRLVLVGRHSVLRSCLSPL